MTNADLLNAIHADENLRKLADSGQDGAIADAINSVAAPGAPITAALLAKAAPKTMAAIAASPNPLSEMDVIAERIRQSDSSGIGQWADTLLMLGKMSQSEHDAVELLVSAAKPPEPVSHAQVSAVLNLLRPTVGDAVRALPINWS